MAKKKIEQPTPTHPIREVCGDCYYNGFCWKDPERCKYLQPKNEEDEEEDD